MRKIFILKKFTSPPFYVAHWELTLGFRGLTDRRQRSWSWILLRVKL